MRHSPCLLAAGLALAACAAAHDPAPGAAPPARRGGVTVLTRADLARAGGAELLAVLASRVSNIRVERRSATSPCPVITLRGDRTMTGTRNPLLYVDGTEMTDTCVLTQIRTDDVEAVEIYPGGISARPGYRSHTAGLILVFMVGGQPRGG